MIQIGDAVILTAKVKPLAPYHHKRGEVAFVVTGGPINFAHVLFDLGEGEIKRLVKDIPVAYLSAAPTEKAKRKGVLNLHEPKDERSEKEKEAEAQTWLESLGYQVLGVGQTRVAAVCYGCLSDAQKEAKAHGGLPRRVGPTLCPIHRRPVYSMSTGSTPGVSDWQIRHPLRWPAWAVLLAEWKKDATSKRRAEQVTLSNAGWYPIVSSIGEIAEAVCRFEDALLGIDVHPEILAKALQHGGMGEKE